MGGKTASWHSLGGMRRLEPMAGLGWSIWLRHMSLRMLRRAVWGSGLSCHRVICKGLDDSLNECGCGAWLACCRVHSLRRFWVASERRRSCLGRRSLSIRGHERGFLRMRGLRTRRRRGRGNVHNPILCLDGMIIHIVVVDRRRVVVIKDKVSIIPFIIPAGTTQQNRVAAAFAEALWHRRWRNDVVLDIHRMVILVMIFHRRCILAVKLDLSAVATIVTGGTFNQGNSAVLGRCSRLVALGRLTLLMGVWSANVRPSIIALPEALHRRRVEDRGRMDDGVFDINRVIIFIPILHAGGI